MTGAQGDAERKREAAMAQLRERFKSTIGNTLTAFRQLSAQLATTPASPEVVETLRRELHRVRGTAGSYGFHAASELAAQLEERAVRWTREPTLEPSERSSIIQHFAAALELAFRVEDTPSGEIAAHRTLVLVDAPPHLADPIRAEAALRGYRIAALSLAQASLSMLREIEPHVIAVPVAQYPRVAEICWSIGVPLIILEERERAQRTPLVPAPVGGMVSVDVTSGVAPVFEVAERLVLRSSWTGATILALDDDPSILAMVRFVLEGPDVRVVTLEDPTKLREEIDRVLPTLLLLDISMPGFSGIEIARTLRQDDALRDLPIVMLSSEIDSASRAAAHEAGADEFVPKPIVALELKARVQSRLERHRLSRLADGLHPVTGLPMLTRSQNDAEDALRAIRERDERYTIAVIRPVGGEAAGDAAAAWLRESHRIATALRSAAPMIGYFEGTGMIAVFDRPAERVSEMLNALVAGTTPETAWKAGIVDGESLPGEDFSALRRAAEEALDVALRADGEHVHRWQRDEAMLAPDVIVVEDDPALSDMLQYALRATGFTYRAFGNGRVALDHLVKVKVGTKRPFVLLDVDLPGLDGYSLHEQLRVQRPGDFHVVFLTVHASESDQLRALRSGAMDYITKPINLRVLMAKMQTWMEARGRL